MVPAINRETQPANHGSRSGAVRAGEDPEPVAMACRSKGYWGGTGEGGTLRCGAITGCGGSADDHRSGSCRVAVSAQGEQDGQDGQGGRGGQAVRRSGGQA